MNRKGPTGIGFIAVLLWSLLALLTAASGGIPPFQLTAMTFALGSLVGFASWLIWPPDYAALREPLRVWVLGIGGYFGFHFAYFTALRNAPPIEAGLITYLWPILIVMLATLLPGERTRFHHVAGAIAGLCGAALVVTKGQALRFQSEYAFGYGMALVAALTWSTYSVLSRKYPKAPTHIVAGYCAATALLAAIAHLILEETVWPSDILEWLAVAGLGIGPVGIAFYAWDFGVKHGDIQVLGTTSYFAPVISTLLLALAGYGYLTSNMIVACVLITAGALLAARELFQVPRASASRKQSRDASA